MRSGGNSYSTTTTQLLVASIMKEVGELLPDNVHIPDLCPLTFVVWPLVCPFIIREFRDTQNWDPLECACI